MRKIPGPLRAYSHAVLVAWTIDAWHATCFSSLGTSGARFRLCGNMAMENEDCGSIFYAIPRILETPKRFMIRIFFRQLCPTAVPVVLDDYLCQLRNGASKGCHSEHIFLVLWENVLSAGGISNIFGFTAFRVVRGGLVPSIRAPIYYELTDHNDGLELEKPTHNNSLLRCLLCFSVIRIQHRLTR